MSKGSVGKLVETLINEKLNQINIELLEVQYRHEQNGQMLRIFIDTETGVSLDTCTQATRAIHKILDEHDEINFDFMEVSSPGIDRVLRKDSEFLKFSGEQIKVKTYQPIDGQKNFVGKLIACDKDLLTIELADKTLQIPRELLSIVRLNPDL